ncbi:MAG TPA: hypothetical protein VK843_05105 [Planctomycetota bacterium]|nr:hypothetical protein [Planctomycetota bacterium]
MGSQLFFQPIVYLTAIGLLLGIAIVVFAPRIRSVGKHGAPALSRGRRAFLLATIGASLLLCVFAAGLAAGYEDSPYGMLDSQGHALGFNEPLTWELARMALGNATAGSFVFALGLQGCLLVVLHLIAIAFLAGALRSTPRMAAWFCWLQFAVFPLGWLGCVMLFDLVVDREIDGEGLVDIPFWWTFQPVWLFAAGLAGWWLQRASPAVATSTPVPIRESSVS